MGRPKLRAAGGHPLECRRRPSWCVTRRTKPWRDAESDRFGSCSQRRALPRMDCDVEFDSMLQKLSVAFAISFVSPVPLASICSTSRSRPGQRFLAARPVGETQGPRGKIRPHLSSRCMTISPCEPRGLHSRSKLLWLATLRSAGSPQWPARNGFSRKTHPGAGWSASRTTANFRTLAPNWVKRSEYLPRIWSPDASTRDKHLPSPSTRRSASSFKA